MEEAYLCEVCGTKYKSISDLEKHKSSETCSKLVRDSHEIKKAKNRKKFICLFCGYKASKSSDLVQHNRTHTDEKPYQCQACEKSFKLKISLKTHIRLHCPAAKAIGLELQDDADVAMDVDEEMPDAHEEEGEDQSSKDDDTSPDQISEDNENPLSTKGNSDDTNSKAAKTKPKGRLSVKCHICSKAFARPQDLTLHLKARHPEVEKPFTCLICPDKFFRSLEDRNLHLVEQHPEEFKINTKGNFAPTTVNKLQCPYCPQMCNCKAGLRIHIISHTNMKPHVCEVCGLKYKHSISLRKHLAQKKCQSILSSRRNKQKCDQCDSWVQPEYMATHIEVSHTIQSEDDEPIPVDEEDPTKKWKCKYCPQRFDNMRYKKTHESSHGTNYVCEFCSVGYNSYPTLRSHTFKFHPGVLVTMTKEHHDRKNGTAPPQQDPPSCSSVKDKKKTKDPLAVISKRKPSFKCPFCPKVFDTTGNRNTHEEIHGPIDYVCEFCPLEFKTHNSMMCHINRHHPGNLITMTKEHHDQYRIASNKSVKVEQVTPLSSMDQSAEEDFTDCPASFLIPIIELKTEI